MSEHGHSTIVCNANLKSFYGEAVQEAINLIIINYMIEKNNQTPAAESSQQPESPLQPLADDLYKSMGVELSDIVAKIPDLSAQINELLAKEKNSTRGVKTLIVKTITDAADDNLVVPNYVPSTGSAQKVFHFVQTHWKELERQAFFDFVKACCAKMKLPDYMLVNSSFMNQIFEDLALNISHVCKQIEVKGEVWINFKNCTLRITQDGNSEQMEHKRSDFFRYVLPYDFDPTADCPMWKNFLNEVLPDISVQDVLAEGIGLCLAPDIKSEKMLVFFGYGSNGKSVVLDIVESVFGSENVSNVPLSELTEDSRQRCLLENKLVNISTESDKELNASVLKAMVSGEPVIGYELYRGPRKLTRYARLITSFNLLPRAEATHGFYRRFKIINFPVTIEESKADINLPNKLKQELPGILNWVLEGLYRYLSNMRFSESKSCDEALLKYRLNSDTVQLFLNERCEPNNELWPVETKGSDLYNDYKKFCFDISLRPLGRNYFFDRLISLGYNREDKKKTTWFKIKLSDEYGN